MHKKGGFIFIAKRQSSKFISLPTKATNALQNNQSSITLGFLQILFILSHPYKFKIAIEVEKLKIKCNKYKMENNENNIIIKAYQRSQELKPLFDIKSCFSSLPLTFEDSLSPVPDHPSCAIGTLTSQAKWGSRKGTAFVVEDNYLLTCASNCYSHQHGQYSNITFTINSNRKHGYDTHKVTKVFIPQQYKQLSQNERKEYNYALLYIEGELNMKDRYGSIGISFHKNEMKDNYQQCLIKKQDYLWQYQSRPLQQYESPILNGEPLLSGDKAIGLVSFEGEDKEPYYLLFGENIHFQLAEWVKVPKGQFQLQRYSADEMDASCLKDKEIRPIKQVDLSFCKIDERFCSFLKELPFSDISELVIFSLTNNIGDNLYFLKLDKFKNIKSLWLGNQQIGPSGCQAIAFLSLSNLRELSLWNYTIRDQDCRHLSKADWPFLKSLSLGDCSIWIEGVRHLLQSKRRNLCQIHLFGKNFDNDVSAIFQKADLPRINNLSIRYSSINELGLAFLKASSWQRLSILQLSGNPVGSKGCKMIKEAGLVLQELHLNGCHIDSVGIKWICKANLTQITWFSVHDNSLGDKGCFYLSRAHMPNLEDIDLRDNGICIKGVKWLLEADWSQRVANNELGSFRQLIKSFGRLEFEGWLQI